MANDPKSKDNKKEPFLKGRSQADPSFKADSAKGQGSNDLPEGLKKLFLNAVKEHAYKESQSAGGDLDPEIAKLLWLSLDDLESGKSPPMEMVFAYEDIQDSDDILSDVEQLRVLKSRRDQGWLPKKPSQEGASEAKEAAQAGPGMDLPPEQYQEIFTYLTSVQSKKIHKTLSSLAPEKIQEALRSLSPRQINEVLAALEPEDAEMILGTLAPEEAQEYRETIKDMKRLQELKDRGNKGGQ